MKEKLEALLKMVEELKTRTGYLRLQAAAWKCSFAVTQLSESRLALNCAGRVLGMGVQHTEVLGTTINWAMVEKVVVYEKDYLDSIEAHLASDHIIPCMPGKAQDKLKHARN